MTSWNQRTNPESLPRISAEAARSLDRPDAHPLGFADVRESRRGVHAVPRNPIGFAPTGMPLIGAPPHPAYQTELSFRRDRQSAPDIRCEALPSQPYDEPQRGHAESRPSDQSAELWPGDKPTDSAPEDVSHTEIDAVDEPENSDPLPFYKREIGFRWRKKPEAQEPIAPVAAHVELVEERAADEVVAVHEPGDDLDYVAVIAAESEPEAEISFVDELDPIEQVDSDSVDAAEQPHGAFVEAEQAFIDETDEFLSDEPEALSEAVEELSRDEAPAPIDELEQLEQLELPEAPPSDVNADVSLEDEDAQVVSAEADEPPAASVPSSPTNGEVGPDHDKKASKRSGRGGGGRGQTQVGVKIGGSQIAAGVVIETDGRHELVELARCPLDTSVVVDGEIRDPAALTSALKTLFDEWKLPRNNVRIGLASNRIGVRIVDIVGVDDDARFDNAVRFKAHEVLPVAAHESVLDYRIVEQSQTESGESLKRVLIVVAPREQVVPYVDVCRNAGIKLTGVDLEALGLLRAFVDPVGPGRRAADDTATVIVSIGHAATTLLVAGGGICEFTRSFDWGGGSLVDAIATELEVGQGEAETILRHISLAGPGPDLESLDAVARARAVEAIRSRLTPFARELVGSLQFYQTQPGSLGIGEILITGGTSQLLGLSEALHQMIGVAVRVGDPLGRVVAKGAFAAGIEASIGSMAVPIGLAIDDGSARSVNLLPKDLAKQPRKKPNLIAVGAPLAAAVPIAAMAFLFMQASGKVTERQESLDAVTAQIAALPEPVGPTLDPGITGVQAQRATALSTVLGGRLAWEHVLGDISRVLPETVWLDQLKAQAPDPALTAAAPLPIAGVSGGTGAVPPQPTGVTIEGFTYTQPDVAKLLSRLSTVPGLVNVTLKSSASQKLGKKRVIRFSVLADLKIAGGSR